MRTIQANPPNASRPRVGVVSSPNGNPAYTVEHCGNPLNDLLEIDPRDFGRQDFALLNLLCAPSLPGSEDLFFTNYKAAERPIPRAHVPLKPSELILVGD